MNLEELKKSKKLLSKPDLKNTNLTKEEIELINQAVFSTEPEVADRIRAIEFLLLNCPTNADILEYDAGEYESELREKLQELQKSLASSNLDEEGEYGFGDELESGKEERYGFGDELSESG